MARPKAFQVLDVSATLLSVLLRLPIWALTNALPSWRPRRTWSFSGSVLVQAIREATYAIADPLNRDVWLSSTLEDCPRDARKLGFVWVEPIPDEYVVGEVREMAEVNGVRPERIGGFWYVPRPRVNASCATSTEGRIRCVIFCWSATRTRVDHRAYRQEVVIRVHLSAHKF